MTHFNFHSKGFMYIEVMFAIALLGIFGSTLFIAESSLFQKLLRSHVAMFSTMNMENMILEYKMKLQQSEFSQSGQKVQPMSKTYQNPYMVISVSGSYVIPTESKSAIDDVVYLYTIKASAKHEHGEDAMTTVLYKPKENKK